MRGFGPSLTMTLRQRGLNPPTPELLTVLYGEEEDMEFFLNRFFHPQFNPPVLIIREVDEENLIPSLIEANHYITSGAVVLMCRELTDWMKKMMAAHGGEEYIVYYPEVP